MSEKKKLSARAYLNQLQVIDNNINDDIARLSEMKMKAVSSGAIDYSKDHVQTSPAGDKLCSDVSRYLDFDAKINAEIDRFVDAKEQIIREIRELRVNNYVQLLYKVYVQYKSLKVASQEMKLSYSYVTEVHKKALTAFEETHKNLYYLT